MIGTAPNSLINTIDTADLIKKGQKEAAVMFSCLVAPTGQVVTSGAYRGTRGSELLEQELLKRLVTAKFIPAVHNHEPVIAVFYGTVKFAVVNGKPRLRIFAKAGDLTRRPVVAPVRQDPDGNGGPPPDVRSLAMDEVLVPMVVVDADGRVVQATAAARTLFGLRAKDLGSPPPRLFSPKLWTCAK